MLALLGLISATAGPAEASRVSNKPSRAEQPLPKGFEFPVTKTSVLDPTDDTLGSGDNDITSFTAEGTPDHLGFCLTFANAVDTDDLDGVIDIDVDQNGATGQVPNVDSLFGSEITGMGIEFAIDLFTLSTDGTVGVFDELSGTEVGRAPVTTTTYSLCVWVDTALFGGDRAVNTAAVVGTGAELITDVVPNMGSLATGLNDNTSILLNGSRFLASVEWEFPPTFPGPRPMRVSELRTEDSGFFYLIDRDNIELIVKALDGCDINGHFWVFIGGVTDVGFTATVTDTKTGESKTYTNPLGNAADAIKDTTAFATCP